MTMPVSSLNQLVQRKANLIGEACAILDGAQSQGRLMTEEEKAAHQAKLGEIDAVVAEIRAEERQRELEVGIASEGQAVLGQVIERSPRIEVTERRRPFASFGEKLLAIAQAGTNPHAPLDPRLVEDQRILAPT
jgi:hypothetical protein